MLDRLAGLPFWPAFIGLFAVVLVRSNATYWVGRGAIVGWQRRRRGTDEQVAFAEATELAETAEATPEQADRQLRAHTLLRRLGPLAVTLSYLTVGIQTAVHLGAGAMRMPLSHYVPASIIGSAAWSGLYSTIGLAIVQAWIAAEAGSWYGLGAIAALVLVGVSTWLVTRHRARRPSDPRQHRRARP